MLDDYLSFEDITLHRADQTDVPDLVKLINDAYAYQDAAKGEPRTNSDHLRKRLQKTEFYAAKRGDDIVGCVYLEPKDTALHFGLLTVSPEFRGKGLAVAIMDATQCYAREKNFEAIELDYMSLAPWLKTYYERYGFSETGHTTAWGMIELIRMRKKLA